jgi:hypothetical protein
LLYFAGLKLTTLITKIKGLPIVGVKPEEYLDNKSQKKDIIELVKEQFGSNRGNMGIVLRDISDNMTRFPNKLMHCKVLRKCTRRGSSRSHGSGCAMCEGSNV